MGFVKSLALFSDFYNLFYFIRNSFDQQTGFVLIALRDLLFFGTIFLFKKRRVDW